MIDDVVKQKLEDWYIEEEENLLSLLSELVSINSFTSNIAGVNQVQSVLQQEFEEIGMVSERFPFPTAGDLLKVDSAEVGDSPILLIGHSDTVHKDDPRFCALDIEGDIARGPGVLDMKGGLCVMLYALKALSFLGKLQTLPIRVLVIPDEEKGSVASRPKELELAKGAQAALVFEFGRDGGNVVTRRGGLGMWKVDVFGKAGHAGNDHEVSANAIVGLSKFVCEASDLTDYQARATVNFGLTNGGTAVNVVPDSASASFEVRSSSKQAYEKVKSNLESIASRLSVDGIKVELAEKLKVQAMEETDASAELFEQYKKAGKLAGLNFERVKNVSGGVSDANNVASLGIPTIDGLGPLGAGAHSKDEYLELSTLKPKILNLVYWLLSLDQPVDLT